MLWCEKELNFTDYVSSFNRETLSHSSRFLTFLKLFLGMGILWIFEIISGLVGDQAGEESWLVFIISSRTPKCKTFLQLREDYIFFILDNLDTYLNITTI